MKILITLFLCFTVIPIIELTLLIRLSKAFSFISVLALTISTGIIGASLAKSQGRQVIANAQRNLQSGQIPTKELLDGILIIIAGIVLVTPGILTDLFGFSILLPPIRAIYRQILITLFKNSKKSSSFKTSFTQQTHAQQNTQQRTSTKQHANDIIIDAEAEEINDHKHLR